MCVVVPNFVAIPPALVHTLRAAPALGVLVQVGTDVWLTTHAVLPHTDGTGDGLETYGLVLVNDPGYTFVHNGQAHAIPPGTAYLMDGRVMHSTQGGPGLFAALIWDMPAEWGLDAFRADLLADARWTS